MKSDSFIKPTIFGLAIIIASFIFGNSYKNRNAKADSITVTGLGTKNFESNEIFWTGSFDAKAMNAKDAYNLISEEKNKVKQFFLLKGFKENEFLIGGVNFEKTYRTITTVTKENNQKTEQIFDGYTATQSVSFSSRKDAELMKKIETVIDQTAELINSGVQFNPKQVQYTYSDLPSLKHDLIQNATQDAKERAVKIVNTGNGKLGKLKSATMGVFQITGKGAIEEDTNGGNNDTYSKDKTARITIRLTYVLD